ncbi:MAG: CHAD domain-containing protein [Actinomycetota bacterium]|jgi:CHAD domain-containing protein|nr:CHAD domain-containing protein [Euzebyaceae bacterium]MDQ3530479.1 CHAD domain-containing protein [Actinomycetota bacterium]
MTTATDSDATVGPFQLDAGEPVADGIRRMVASQLDAAIAGLSGTGDDTDDGKTVHEARKSCKRVRATLRLGRKALGSDCYGWANTEVRDAARTLSRARDAAVLATAFDQLLAEAGRPRSFAAVRRRLNTAASAEAGHEGDALAEAATRLGGVRDSMAQWPRNADGWKALGSGLQRIYGKGRKAMTAAVADPSDEALHDWRKTTKYLWHALELLRPAWPGTLKPLAKQAHELSDLLGDDHDLAVLTTVLQTGGGLPPTLRRLIEQRRAELQRDAVSLGQRLYAESPQDFTRRIGAVHRLWRREAAAAP